MGGDDGRQCHDHGFIGQIIASRQDFQSGWRILQNKKSKKGGIIISNFLRNGKTVYREGGKSTYQTTGKLPYRSTGKST